MYTIIKLLGGFTMKNINHLNSNAIFNTQYKINLNQANSINKNKNSTQDNNTSLKINQKNGNSLIESLQKNIQQLEQQKESLKDQKLDPKDLLEKSKKIDEQISKIKAEIQQSIIAQKQADAERLKDELEKKRLEEKKYTKEDDEVRDGVIISSSLNILIQANHSKKITNNLKELKSRYESSNPEIAQKITSTILREFNKTDKAIKKEQNIAIDKLKNGSNTNDANNKIKDEEDTDNVLKNSDNLQNSQTYKNKKNKVV
jgi:tetrahydromethanopterin S-methyltransferase subunit G